MQQINVTWNATTASIPESIVIPQVSAKTGAGVTHMLNGLAEKLVEQRVRTGRSSDISNPRANKEFSERIPLISKNVGTASDYVDLKDVDDGCCPCCVIL